jgi:hypothetical protein
MSRYSSWAGKGTEGTPIRVSRNVAPTAPPQVVIQPPPTVPHQMFVQPTTGRVLVQVPHYGTSHRPIQRLDPVPPSCVLVKGGQPNWDACIASLPDLAKQAGVDLSGGVDAVNDFAGRPEGAVMAHWTPNSRFYNGVTEATAKGHVDGHISAKGDSLQAVRQSSAKVVKGGSL